MTNIERDILSSVSMDIFCDMPYAFSKASGQRGISEANLNIKAKAKKIKKSGVILVHCLIGLSLNHKLKAGDGFVCALVHKLYFLFGKA